MNHIHLIAVLLFCLLGICNTAAQKISNLSEKEIVKMFSPYKAARYGLSEGNGNFQLLENDDSSHTLITYHPNGKVKSKTRLSIYYNAGSDTVMIIDPITLEEDIIVYSGYRARLNGSDVYFDTDGNKLQETLYAYDRKAGTSKKWYSNGVLKSEENFVDGELTGKCQYWYPNGSIERIQHLPVGAYQEYYENGQLRVEGNYVFYLPEPDTVMVINPVTLEERLQVTTSYERPGRDGEWIYYDEKGKVLLRERYVKGVKK